MQIKQILKNITSIKATEKLVLLILVVLIIPTFYRLLRPGYFSMQDDLQAFRIHQMNECIKDVQIPCRWVPDAGYQYGYPQFNYYAPGVYYLGEIIHLLGIQFVDTVKILFILGYILSAITMYLLVRSFLGRWPAIVSAMLYTYVPYKAVEVYVRGAMSEFWELAILPLVFWSSYQLIIKGKLKYIIWFSVSIGLLFITHNLITIIFLPIAAVWSLFWLLYEKKWKALPKLIAAGALGIGLAAFFVLPVAFERQFAHVDSILSGYFDYRQHFVDLYQLFLSNNWGYGSSELGPGDDLNLSTGIIHWILGLAAGILAWKNFKKKRKIALLAFLLLGIEVIVLFLMHLRSSFVWEILSILVWLQFPWRLMINSIFLLSILSGIAVYLAGKGKYILGVVAIISAFVLYAGYFQPKDWQYISDKEKFSGKLWEKQLTISIFDYLPIYAELPPPSRAPDYPEVLEGQLKFLDYKKGSNYQLGEVEVGKKALIRLPLFDFPGMVVKVDGKKVNHWSDDCRDQPYCLGLITFNLSEGKHSIEAKLTNTPVRLMGNIISSLSIIVLAYLIVKSIRHEEAFT
jgi:hypothetical protein